MAWAGLADQSGVSFIFCSALRDRLRVVRVFAPFITYWLGMNSAIKALRLTLLDWYDAHARALPWRVSPTERTNGILPDPYAVWLSEMMLQQTTITTVRPYFAKFLTAFPSVQAMAAAPLDGVLSLWAGLGYYARARNLHKCALAIAGAGGFPSTPEGLSAFPGIGPYTSAAIASIAFDYPSVPVDGNVERVLSRLLHIDAVLPAGKPAFRQAAAQFEDAHRPGDFAQALMDLGSTICTPRKPNCEVCPWSSACLGRAAGDAETYPRKAAKKVKPIRYGTAFVHLNENGVLVSRRPEKGLLGGMLEVPGTDWETALPAPSKVQCSAPYINIDWQKAMPIRHIFTHFDLRLEVLAARSTHTDNAHRIEVAALDQAALPSVMMKVIKSGLAALNKG